MKKKVIAKISEEKERILNFKNIKKNLFRKKIMIIICKILQAKKKAKALKVKKEIIIL